MRAFITGSRAYGKPKRSSDVDLVVLVRRADLEVLRLLCDDDDASKKKDSDAGPTAEGPVGSASLRFGRLNLICLTDPVAYEVWAEGTKKLLQDVEQTEQPVARDVAIAFFDQLRRHRGLFERAPSVQDAKRRPGKSRDRNDDDEDIPF